MAEDSCVRGSAGRRLRSPATLKRSGGGFRFDFFQLGIQPFYLAFELLIAADQLVGILALKVKIRVIHLHCEFAALGFLALDTGLELLATFQRLFAAALGLAIIDALGIAIICVLFRLGGSVQFRTGAIGGREHWRLG